MFEDLKRARMILTRSELKKLALLGAGSVILSLTEAISIGIIIPIISLFMSPEKIQQSPVLKYLYGVTGAHDTFSFLALLAIVAFALFVFKFLYSIAILYQQQLVVGKIYNRLTSRVLTSYLDRSYAFHLNQNSSVLFKNVMIEASNYVYYFLSPIIIIVSEAVIMVGICVLLFAIYPLPMSLLVICFGSVALAVNYLFKKRIRSYAAQREAYNAHMFKTALEALGAVKEIHMYGARDYFVSRYREATERYTSGFMKFSVVNGLPRYIFETVLFGFVLLVILASAYLQIPAADLMPMLMVIGVASLRLLPSLSKIYNNINLFHYSKNSIDMMWQILHEDSLQSRDRKPVSKAAVPSVPEMAICLDGVTFRYESAPTDIFNRLSVGIPHGKVCAIMGQTGSGKSTLIDLMMALLVPSEGELYYRGRRIDADSIDAYREKIGYVPQNIFLIDDTVSANVAFGVPAGQVDRARLDRALEIAQLGSFVEGLPKGIDTVIGERGARISGGQRQRIGIARALYRRPEILILDEATSALDAQTEADVLNAVRTLEAEGMTVVLIAHRLSTIACAELIYVMDGGRIIEKGSYAYLIAGSEYFRKISRQQDAATKTDKDTTEAL